jgi:hypothetical protein
VSKLENRCWKTKVSLASTDKSKANLPTLTVVPAFACLLEETEYLLKLHA